jgi:triosephosphate isomerase (TIM)
LRTPYIAGNWKMHKLLGEAEALAMAVVDGAKGCPNRVMIAPPFTALERVARVVAGSNVVLGAQNMGPEVQGAHTGEVSPAMLKDIGVKTVILGHSERRHSYGEVDLLINRKVRLALEQGLEVILCVGETLAERERGITERLVEEQVTKGLAGVVEKSMASITIAYEPVWAIGTGKTATPQDAQAIHAVIRKLAARLYSGPTSEALIIQYGGSVKADNIRGLMAMQDIDGALVGGASLSAEGFLPIARVGQ